MHAESVTQIEYLTLYLALGFFESTMVYVKRVLWLLISKTICFRCSSKQHRAASRNMFTIQ